MESYGAEQHVKPLYSHDYGVCIGTLVSDKDASVRAHLKHSYANQIQLDSYPELTLWPYYNNGSRKPENLGMLELKHLKIIFLSSDKNHRIHTYGQYLWRCVEGKGNVKISSYGAVRMKRIFPTLFSCTATAPLKNSKGQLAQWSTTTSTTTRTAIVCGATKNACSYQDPNKSRMNGGFQRNTR